MMDHNAAVMNKAAELAQEVRGGRTVIRLSGNLSIACLHDLPDRLDAIEGPVDTIDLSDVGHMDTIGRSEEHTSELQSLMRISYAVFCLKKKKKSHKSINIISQNVNIKRAHTPHTFIRAT